MDQEYKQKLDWEAQEIVKRKLDHCVEFLGIEEEGNNTVILKFKDEDGGTQERIYHPKDGNPEYSFTRGRVGI
jgi:hypothetical protein